MRYLFFDAFHQFQPNSSCPISLYFNEARSNIPRSLGCNNILEAARQLDMHSCIEVFAISSFTFSLGWHLTTRVRCITQGLVSKTYHTPKSLWAAYMASAEGPECNEWIFGIL